MATPFQRRDDVARHNAVVMKNWLICHTKIEGECWRCYPATPSGYAGIYFRGASYRAHRCSLLWTGDREDAHFFLACHKCRNRNCVRPEHLYWGTIKENADDAVRDGTSISLRDQRGELNRVAKLTDAKVREMWKMFANGDISGTKLALRYGVSSATLFRIFQKKIWKHVTADLPDLDAMAMRNLNYVGSGNPRAQMTERDVITMHEEYRQGHITVKGLATKYGFSHSSVAQMISGGNWGHVTGKLPPIPEWICKKNIMSGSIKRIAKVSDAQVMSIRCDAKRGVTSKALAAKHKVSLDIIYGIVSRRTFKHLPEDD